MIELRPYQKLGTADFGWLKPHYHFSFSSYHDASRMGHGVLRVINDDSIAPHSGFEMHPHRDMEIITYVREGAITHRDSLGNEGITRAGEVQIMSAGTGIVHAEHNETDVPTTLYQIWIMPREKGVAPRWEHTNFPKSQGIRALVSGHEDDVSNGALMMHQDAAIYGGNLLKGTTAELALRGDAYVLAAAGSFSINDVALAAGDGAATFAEDRLQITAQEDSDLLIIEVPSISTI